MAVQVNLPGGASADLTNVTDANFRTKEASAVAGADTATLAGPEIVAVIQGGTLKNTTVDDLVTAGLPARLTDIVDAAGTAAEPVYPVEAGTGMYLSTANRGALSANGVRSFIWESQDGVNYHFGAPHNFTATSGDGEYLSDFHFDGDEHYLHVRGIIGVNNQNPFNLGLRNFNGSHASPTGLAQGESMGIIWWQPMDSSGNFQPEGESSPNYGRSAQIGAVCAQTPTTTARGGVLYFSATPNDTYSQKIQAYVHGPTNSLVVAGAAADSISSVVTGHVGYGALTVYMVNASTQMAASFRDVASVDRGVDIGWDTADSRLKFYSVTANNPSTVCSIDPATGNWGFGSNQNLLYVDVTNDKVYFGAASSLSGVAAKLQATRSGAAATAFERTTDNGEVTLYYRSGVLVGSVSVTTTNTTYNTSSDARLKEVLGDLTAGEVIDAIVPRRYRWTSTGEEAVGFIAQEVHAHAPQAVRVGSEAGPGEDGFQPWMIDKADLIPYLWAEVRALRQRMAALEG
jgi:hypothetical protein